MIMKKLLLIIMLQIKQIKNMNSFIVFEKNLYNVYIKILLIKNGIYIVKKRLKKLMKMIILQKIFSLCKN